MGSPLLMRVSGNNYIQNSIQPTTCLGKNHTVGMTAIK